MQFRSCAREVKKSRIAMEILLCLLTAFGLSNIQNVTLCTNIMNEQCLCDERGELLEGMCMQDCISFLSVRARRRQFNTDSQPDYRETSTPGHQPNLYDTLNQSQVLTEISLPVHQEDLNSTESLAIIPQDQRISSHTTMVAAFSFKTSPEVAVLVVSVVFWVVSVVMAYCYGNLTKAGMQDPTVAESASGADALHTRNTGAIILHIEQEGEHQVSFTKYKNR